MRAGRVLIELDPDFLKEEVAKLEREWAAQSLKAARLDAEASGVDLEFSTALEASRPDLAMMQRRLYAARRHSLAARRDAAARVIEPRARRRREASARACRAGENFGAAA